MRSAKMFPEILHHNPVVTRESSLNYFSGTCFVILTQFDLKKLLVVFSICIMDDLHFRYNYVVNQRKKFIMNEGQIISATSETPS